MSSLKPYSTAIKPTVIFKTYLFLGKPPGQFGLDNQKSRPNPITEENFSKRSNQNPAGYYHSIEYNLMCTVWEVTNCHQHESFRDFPSAFPYVHICIKEAFSGRKDRLPYPCQPSQSLLSLLFFHQRIRGTNKQTNKKPSNVQSTPKC